MKDPYFEYINFLSSKNIISWFPDGNFKPNNPITRAEFLKIIFLVSDTKLSDDQTSRFDDIKVWWQNKYINTWVDLWIISYQNKKFNPNGNVSRVEALKMIILLFIWEINNTYTKNIKDVFSNNWYAKYVEYALDNDLLKLTSNYFNPNKFISRYEVVWILKKITKK